MSQTLTDKLVKEGLKAFESENSSYNGLKCNCSDYAKEGILYSAPAGQPLNNYREQIGFPTQPRRTNFIRQRLLCLTLQ